MALCGSRFALLATPNLALFTPLLEALICAVVTL
jgi:hypothetical protein